MSLPETYEEWQKLSRAWQRRARKLIGDAKFAAPRTRPRDPDEEKLLRKLGLSGWQPFARLRDESHPAREIRWARKKAGLSQAELAARVGVSQQQIQRLEDPARSNPTWETLERIAAALGCRTHLAFEDD